MSFQKQIRVLKNGDLSTNDLQTALNTIHMMLPLSDTDSLTLASILFDKVLPNIYTLIEPQTKKVIWELISSKVGLFQLIRVINNTEVDPRSLQSKYIFIDLFCHIIQNVKFLIETFTEYNGRDYDSWKSLFTVKIIDCLGFINVWCLDNPASSNRVSIIRDDIKRIEQIYVTGMTSNILQAINKFEKYEALHCCRQIISYFLSTESESTMNAILNNWAETKKLYTNTDNFKGKKMHQLIDSQKGFLFNFIKSMNTLISEDNYLSFATIVNDLNTCIDILGFKNAILSHIVHIDPKVTFIWIMQISQIEIEFVYDQLKKFGNKSYMLTTSPITQNQFTTYILIMFHFLDREIIAELGSNMVFLDAISSRLEARSTTLRHMGMFLADFVYKKSNDKFLFDIKEYVYERTELFNNLSNIEKHLKSLNLEKDVQFTIDHFQTSKCPIKKAIPANKILESPVMIDVEYNSDEEDSDLEDSSINRKPSVAKPVFLKDLLYYMTCDSQKDLAAYEKRKIAFSIGIEMIRIKANTQELKYYSLKLVDAALDIDSIGFPVKPTNKLDKDQLSEALNSWRVSFLIALCVSSPDETFKYLIKGFLSNDWNVTIRIQVLTCIGLGCRELSGKDDSFIWGKKNVEKVRPQPLPHNSHEAFLQPNLHQSVGKIQDIEQKLKEQKLEGALGSVGIYKGTVIHRSRKLDIDKKGEPVMISARTITTTFINKSLPKIFFTLVAVWQQVNSQTHGEGFRIGSMSESLNSQYLDLITTVYRCAIPNCIELVEMSLELIFILCGAMKIIQTSPISDFPVHLLESCIKGLHSLLAENERTLSVLKATAPVQMATIFECYTQLLSNAPPIEEPLNSISILLLQQLQQLSIVYQ